MARLRPLLRLLAVAGLAALLTGGLAAPAQAGLPRIVSGAVSPSVITAGQIAYQTIVLSRATNTGVFIYLDGDRTFESFTRGYISVPPGKTRITFPVRFDAKAPTQQVRSVYAQVSGGGLPKLVAQVTVRPQDPAVQGITGFTFDRSVVADDALVTGTITLKSPARAGGVNVDVVPGWQYGGAGMGLPQFLVVPEGATKASFTTRPGTSVPDTIEALTFLGTTRQDAPITVVPATFAVRGGAVEPGQVNEGIVGIGTAANPDGATVALSVDFPGISVPATVTIPPGSPGVSFPITVDAGIPWTQIGTITARWNGQTATDQIFASG